MACHRETCRQLGMGDNIMSADDLPPIAEDGECCGLCPVFSLLEDVAAAYCTFLVGVWCLLTFLQSPFFLST